MCCGARCAHSRHINTAGGERARLEICDRLGALVSVRVAVHDDVNLRAGDCRAVYGVDFFEPSLVLGRFLWHKNTRTRTCNNTAWLTKPCICVEPTNIHTHLVFEQEWLIRLPHALILLVVGLVAVGRNRPGASRAQSAFLLVVMGLEPGCPLHHRYRTPTMGGARGGVNGTAAPERIPPPHPPMARQPTCGTRARGS